jgi:hypothetical protein
MKQIFSAILLFVAFQLQAQKFIVDLDSISENKVFVKSFKWKDNRDTVLALTVKVNGQFYTNSDTSDFNFNLTFEGKLDSAKGVKAREKQIQKDAEDVIRREEARLLRLYEKNKDVDPKLKEKVSGTKLGIIGTAPTSYSTVAVKKTNAELPPKRKWWQRKK